MKFQLDFKTIVWLLEKQENLRLHNTERASTLITSNSIVIAAYAFLIDNYWSSLEQPHNFHKLFYLVAAIGFVLSGISIIYATRSFVRHKKYSEDLIGNMPKRLFVHSRDTISKYSSYHEFKEGLSDTTEDKLIDHIVSDYYTIMSMHEYGYRQIKISTKFFLISLYCLVLDVCFRLLIVSFFNS